MATKLCTNCGMPFTQIRIEEQCVSCTSTGDAIFRRIREYLYEHQGASASELVSVLGVSMKSIRQFLREERLEVVGDGYSGLRCDKCGVAIKTGRYCETCGREEDNRQKAEAAAAAFNGVKLKHPVVKGRSSISYLNKEKKEK